MPRCESRGVGGQRNFQNVAGQEFRNETSDFVQLIGQFDRRGVIQPANDVFDLVFCTESVQIADEVCTIPVLGLNATVWDIEFLPLIDPFLVFDRKHLAHIEMAVEQFEIFEVDSAETNI